MQGGAAQQQAALVHVGYRRAAQVEAHTLQPSLAAEHTDVGPQRAVGACSDAFHLHPPHRSLAGPRLPQTLHLQVAQQAACQSRCQQRECRGAGGGEVAPAGQQRAGRGQCAHGGSHAPYGRLNTGSPRPCRGDACGQGCQHGQHGHSWQQRLVLVIGA